MTTNILRNFLALIVILLLLQACLKDITVPEPVSKKGPQLFIEGILYPGKPPRIFLSNSEPFFSDRVLPQQVFARGAQVSITSDAGSERLFPDSTFEKFRCRWEPFYKGTIPVERGKTYELNVLYKGRNYTAKTTINQSAIQIEQIRYTAEFYDVYGGHDGVIINFKDAPGPGNYYRFQMNRMIDTSRYHAHALDGIPNTCTKGEQFWISDFGRSIFSDENADGSEMELFIEVSYEYREGDTTWITIQSLDKNTAGFLQDMDDQLQSILNPFVEPVFLDSKIEGDNVLGFFGSAVLSDSVMFIYPRDNP